MPDEAATSTAVEPVRPHRELTAVELKDLAMQKRAAKLAGAHALLPRALHDKPAEIYLILHKADGLGIPEGEAISNLHVIDGKLVPSAQLQAALVRRAGHELQVLELTRDRCVVRARRRGNREWLTVDYTIEDARESGLVDMWVEHQVQDGVWADSGKKRYRTEKIVVGDDRGIFTPEQRAERLLGPLPEWAKESIAQGLVKRKENWWKYRRDMLRARDIAFVTRSEFSDCLLGIGGAFDWTAEDVERAEAQAQARDRGEPELDLDDVYADAEPVDDGEPESEHDESDSATDAEVVVCSHGVDGCEVEGDHTHDPFVAKQYAADDPERPFLPGTEE